MSNRKINIELNVKSIERARKTLNFIQRQYANGKMVQDFLELVCDWIVKRANFYIDNSDIGSLVKLEIRNSWTYTISNGQAKIINVADKAVFVEFGVGLVGSGNPHPNATSQKAQSYKYNISTPYKDGYGMWYFWANSNELDIPRSSIVDIRGYDDFRGKGGEKGKRIIVGTMGAEGVMYAYQALMDAKLELERSNGEIANMWKKVYEEYIGRYLN